MQPIVLLAIVGIAAVGLGLGSLNNVIELDVQQFGVGETDIVTPVTNAAVDFNIGQTTSNNQLYNVVDLCTIEASATLNPGSNVYCKLTDDADRIVAEGHVTLSHTVDTNDEIDVPITQLVSSFSNNVKNIHDVLVVIQAP